MAYKLDVQEFLDLQATYTSAEQDMIPWWALYEKVSEILQAAIDRGAVAAVDIAETEAAILCSAMQLSPVDFEKRYFQSLESV